MLCDEQPEPGGSLLDEHAATIDGQPAQRWLSAAIATLATRPNVTLLNRTTAFGYFPHNLIGLCERLTTICHHRPRTPARASLAGPGSRGRARDRSVERPLVFPGNDRPGVMLASAASTYLHRYGVSVGSRIVVVTGCDAAPTRPRSTCMRPARRLRWSPTCARLRMAPGPRLRVRPVSRSSTGRPSFGTSGRLGIRSVTLGTIADATIATGARSPAMRCSCPAGYTPSVHLFSQSRGKLAWDAGRQAFLPDRHAERERSAGACRGVDGLESVLADGAQAGVAAARAAGRDAEWQPIRAASRDFNALGVPGALRQGGRQAPSRAFVDFQNDVTTKDLALAAREGFVSIEHIKRYTTAGMATDQGKTSNMNALAIVADGLARPLPDVGLPRSGCRTRQ
jgi:sarcosine oxidase subunit alpha